MYIVDAKKSKKSFRLGDSALENAYVHEVRVHEGECLYNLLASFQVAAVPRPSDFSSPSALSAARSP